MRLLTVLTVGVALGATGAFAPTSGQEPEPALEARVWLDRGDEPVLRRGQHVRIYYRTSEDAYAAIFRIDTDGYISLVFPQHPGADTRVVGGRDYRLLLPRSPVWLVDEDAGVGYFFMVASPEPLDFGFFDFDPEGGWNLSGVGETVYEDPYVAIDDYVAAIVPDWENVPYALDFITYNVDQQYSYPRFLCYDCHGPQPYPSWNPYSLICSSYRVVIWDDPYFYPWYRYSGTRLVVTKRAKSLPRYGVTLRTTVAGTRPIVRSRAAPPRRVVEYKEPADGVTPAQRTRSVRSATPRTRAGREATPSSRPTLQRRTSRPSARLPVRAPPTSTTRAAPTPSGSTDRAVSTRTRANGGTRIVRPNRTPTRSGARPQTGAQTRPSRPGTTRRAPAATRGVRPRTPSRPGATTRPPARSRPSARPPSTRRPSARPPASRAPRARPSTGARGSRRPAARAPTTRPTVRARPRAPGRR